MTFLPLFSLFSMISWVIFRLLTLQKEGKKEKKERKYIAAYTPLWHTRHKRTVKDKKKKRLRNIIEVPLLRGVLVLKMFGFNHGSLLPQGDIHN